MASRAPMHDSEASDSDVETAAMVTAAAIQAFHAAVRAKRRIRVANQRMQIHKSGGANQLQKQCGARRVAYPVAEEDLEPPSYKHSFMIELKYLLRSNVAPLLKLLLLAVPFLIPQLGVPTVLMLRLLEQHDSANPYGSSHPLTFLVQADASGVGATLELGPGSETSPMSGRLCITCHRAAATVLNLPCAHRTWCVSCVSTHVAPPPSANSKGSRVICPHCRVPVCKMIRVDL